MEKTILKNINIYELKDIIFKISLISGYREKDILKNCSKIMEISKNKEHHIIKFYNSKENNFFLYDIITNNIVG